MDDATYSIPGVNEGTNLTVALQTIPHQRESDSLTPGELITLWRCSRELLTQSPFLKFVTKIQHTNVGLHDTNQ